MDSIVTTPILEMRGHHQDLSRRECARQRQPDGPRGRDPRHCRRERRRQIDPDEGALRRLSGHGSYEGEIHFEGEERRFHDISDSEKLGIIIIHQELALVPLLSIAENIFLGNEVAKNGIIDWADLSAHAGAAGQGRPQGSPSTLITNLGVGKQQLVEIAKALSKEVKLLILDEPTASLNESDSDALLNLLMEFRRRA
jgi:ABC-type sugar transport system ATPase subunit